MLRNLIRFGVPVAAPALALVLVGLLHPVLDNASYLVFDAAVAVVAVTGGFRPALVSTVLAIAAIDYFFLTPIHSFAVVARTDAGLLGLFGGVALFVSWLTALSHRRLARAKREAVTAAGMASLMVRHAAELEQDLDAMQVLRQSRPKAP